MAFGKATSMISPLHAKKPYFRGKLHRICQYLVLFGGPIHVALFRGDRIGKAALALFYLGGLLLFFVSSLLHSNLWRSPEIDLRVTKIDKSVIFLFIGSSYTCLFLVVLKDMPNKEWVLTVIWVFVVAGVIKCIKFYPILRLISFIFYVLAILITIPLMPAILRYHSWMGIVCYVASIIFTLLSGVAYGLQYPNISPKYFGYHEMFHLLQVIGSLFMVACFSA